ncbi:hypothetical protein LYZ37_07455 [Vibrio tubiashii]|uniref:hypothetical protein n=1 Tax=Vibrio tubiashii TaxID=29498 RepID=UPI001EFCBA00|nr:hypothetical protein [Vibrio tubiashii]MCG9582549.1 hypothetical protein [Vibrio tubiashii]MCG9616140.1 hypothetical protein [Vibrio tubiashii]MCG9689656.1 hypothetical protein [Vibrio tubiashii]WCP68555.1 hypothetical protein LYZ37_07455 [Vibrio tubiashii]
MKRFILILNIALVGCASSPNFEQFNPSEPNFDLATDLELCDYVGAQLPESESATKELVARGALSNMDVEAIRKGGVVVGNSECAVRALWGKRYSSKQIESLNKHGDVQSQATYSCELNGIQHCPFTKISFVNGLIVSIESKN